MAEGEAKDQANLDQGVPVEPGTVVTPGGQAPEQNTPIIKLDPDDPAQPGSVIAPAEPAAQAPVEAPAPPPEPQPAQSNDMPPAATSGGDAISWTASEFVAHDKTAGWYLALLAVAAVAAAVVYLLTKDFVSVAVVVVAAALFAIYGSHKPRQLDFRLDQHGIGVGPKSYSYQEFRYFSVVPEGAFSSIVFMPLKRFSPTLSIYYAPEDEPKILALLSDRLPYEPEHRDAVDSLMRRIRF